MWKQGHIESRQKCTRSNFPFQMPDELSKKNEAAEKGRKRTKDGSSQMDEEDASDQHTSKDAKSATKQQTRGSLVLKRNSHVISYTS